MVKKAAAGVALAATLLAVLPVPAHAYWPADAALALGAFAVFTALFLPFTLLGAVVPPPAVYPAPAPVYATPPYAEPAPVAVAVNREVVFPHGRYVLYGDGVGVAYRWVWVPNPPPPGSAPGY